MLFTSLYLISFTVVLLSLAFEVPSLSFMSTRLWVGFGGFSVEIPLLLSVLMGVWTLGLSHPLDLGACPMGAPIFTPVAFIGTGNFSLGITPHHIKLFFQYLAPSGVDTIHEIHGRVFTRCRHHCGWLP